MHFSITTGVVLLLQILFVGCDQSQTPLLSSAATKCRPHRIAIIGAGPGGSSASYHLEKFAQSSSLDIALDITVFDSNPYIGGRTTTVNALDDPRYPTELGASIFVKINHILYNATRDFELIPSFRNRESAAPDAKYELGIWDGTQFVFKTAHEEGDDDDGTSSSWRGWWDIAKLLWKYGLSPIRTQRATRAALGSFLKFYDDDDGVFPFASLQDAVDSTGLAAYTGLTGKEVLKNAGVSAMFGREIIQASTRVNYASNLGGIHGLETLVCMAIEGAMAVDGGNWQIFERMVKESAARVFLNTSVTDVSRSVTTDTAGFARGRYHLRTTNPDLNEYLTADGDRDMGMQRDGDGDGDEHGYDTVIIAAPLQFANLSFTPALVNPPETIPYTSLYVTLLTSPHRLAPKFFGLDRPEDVPSSVITTLPGSLDDQLGSRHGVDGVGPAGFWSVSTLRVLRPDLDGTFSVSVHGPGGPNTASAAAATERAGEEAENEKEGRAQTQTQYLYKIFSPAPLTATFLSDLLGFDLEDTSTLTSPTSTGGDDDDDDDNNNNDNDNDNNRLSQLGQLSQLRKKDITWLHEKMWHSYPYELPRTTFDNFTLSMDMSMPRPMHVPVQTSGGEGGGEEEEEEGEEEEMEEGEGLYYLSSMETLISTMETSALAGMNVARLIVDSLSQSQSQSRQCA
jgi:prenylcysteine oxidase/farnesylcysteine lyase